MGLPLLFKGEFWLVDPLTLNFVEGGGRLFEIYAIRTYGALMGSV